MKKTLNQLMDKFGSPHLPGMRFASIRGGKSIEPRTNGDCTNDDICETTNTGVCTNTGTCDGATNKSGRCSNMQCVF
jgi:hypothetical protein